jgi:hypothetical protein
MRFIFMLASLLSAEGAFASVQLGSGLSSSMSGRLVPGVELAAGTEIWRGSVNSIGVNTGYYYHSSYSAAFFRTWKAGELFWGEVESGLGGGVMYAVRGFRDEGSATETTKDDVAAGPAYFVQWQFAGPVYMKIDMIWGLRGLGQLIGLNGQDVIFFSLGVKAW